MKRLPRPSRRLLIAAGVLVALAAIAIGAGAVGVGASTPPSSTVTVPARAGETVTVTWTGTIPPAATPTSDCNDAVVSDSHLIGITTPRRGYDRIDATFEFSIAWTPSSPSTGTSDEILTVNNADGADPGEGETSEVGSSDGSGTTEKVVAHNLPGGSYSALACGFANAAPQDYTGTLKITTTAKNAEQSLRSAKTDLAFSAAVPADAQRDEAEPLIEIDRDGVIYTCGPTGFSNASDYAQVSTDGGEQFHLLGIPPRGQQGAGGGGDCGLATGVTRNAEGHFQYAYTGLGALSGFVTSTSPDNGHRLATAGFDLTGGVTTEGAAADRQWMTFLDDRTVLLSYNQQQPRNIVVLKSTDGGLTYSPVASIAAPNPEFPGPLGYIPSSNTVFMPWTKGEEVNFAISKDGGTTWTDCAVATGDTVRGGTAGFAVADADAAGNVYVVWADSSRFHTWMSVLPAVSLAGCNQSVDDVRGTDTGQPSVNPGWSAPVQVDRDAVRTTVFPWVAAGGAPGRVAVTFYGTTSDGDPNSGEFDAAWDVYVGQSLNALDSSRTFGQAKATTHPFHYDSICLNGLACDLSAPAGDRTLADFFAIDLNPVDGKLSVVFNRTNKKPDEALGHVGAPMVVTQAAGPSNKGGTVAAGRAVVRSSTDDPAGDALSAYSTTLVGTTPPAPPTTNQLAGDFTSLAIGADATTGGFTVTLKVAGLSTAALTKAMTDTASQSLLWLWRFTNGYTDSAVSARWNPAQGFTFGFDDYTTGGGLCDSLVPGEKCQVYPGAKPIQGSVNQLAGTITLVVPRSYLRQLSGTDAAARPVELPAGTGARFYDGTAFSVGNTTSPTQEQQTFLYPLDNSPAMDFVLP
jgi:hypothetical protein